MNAMSRVFIIDVSSFLHLQHCAFHARVIYLTEYFFVLAGIFSQLNYAVSAVHNVLS